MRIILTFLLNAGLNFATGLVIAAALGPELYGRFAVGLTAATLIATGVFDWLRLSTTRYYGDAREHAEPAVRRTIGSCYGALTALVAAAAVLAAALPLGLTAVFIGAVAVMAVANGVFDYQTALARALFRDGPYATLVLGKGVLGIVLAFGAGFLGRDPALVLAAQGVGTLLAIVPAFQRLRDKGERGGPAELGLIRRFARYGVPVVAANVVFQGITLTVRSAAAASLGYAAAGHLSLATDLELRLLLASGAAIDVLVFQLAVRSESQGGRAAANAQLRTNMAVVAAVLTLIAVGFVATLPAFLTLVVPARFHDGFGPLALALLPGVFLFCLGQFALNPVFQMQHRTVPITVAALVSAAAVGIGLACLRGHLGPLGFAVVHAGGLGVGFAVLAVPVFRDAAMRPRWRDGAGIAAAAGVTLACLWPLRAVAPALLSLGLSAMVGPLVYGAVLLACDVGPCRSMVRPWLVKATRRLATQSLA